MQCMGGRTDHVSRGDDLPRPEVCAAPQGGLHGRKYEAHGKRGAPSHHLLCEEVDCPPLHTTVLTYRLRERLHSTPRVRRKQSFRMF